MNKMIALGMAMMDKALTYPNDMIANAFARTGDKLVHQGMPYVAALDETDHKVIAFFRTLA